MQGRLLAVAAIFILFGFGVGALQQGYFDAGIEGGAANTDTETVTVSEGNITQLSQSNNDALVYDDEENVTVEQNNDEFIAQGNWSWFQHNGTIFWEEGSDLDNNQNADVTYTFAEPTHQQEIARDLSVGLLNPILDEWVFVAGIILVLAAAAIVGGRA